MPFRVFATILVSAILAAGLTVWAALAFGDALGGAGIGLLALPALLAWGVVRLISARSGPR